MARDETGLCNHCFYRKDSRRRVEEYVQMRFALGQKPPFTGMVNDPSPRAECKRHEGYNVDPAETKVECSDFVPVEMTRDEKLLLFQIAGRSETKVSEIKTPEERKALSTLVLRGFVEWKIKTNTYLVKSEGFTALAQEPRMVVR